MMFLRSILPSIKILSPLQNLEFKGDVINLLKSKLHPTYGNHHCNSTSLESTSSSAPSPYSGTPSSFQSAPSPIQPTTSSNQL
jgi:hypothetical protein